MAPIACDVQRRHTIVHWCTDRCIDLGSSCQQPLQHLLVALLACHEQWRRSLNCLCVGVGPSCKQLLPHLPMVVRACNVQGRPPVVYQCIDVGPSCKQSLHHCISSIKGGQEQRRPAFLVSGFQHLPQGLGTLSPTL